jgi:hypothetical protein
MSLRKDVRQSTSQSKHKTVTSLRAINASGQQGIVPWFELRRAPKGIGSAPTPVPKHGRAELSVFRVYLLGHYTPQRFRSWPAERISDLNVVLSFADHAARRSLQVIGVRQEPLAEMMR